MESLSLKYQGYTVMTTPFTLLCLLIISFTECCTNIDDCGWKSSACLAEECSCPTDYKIHDNGRDCIYVNCTASVDCLECTASAVCRRCVHFIDEESKDCIDTCSGEAKFLYDDNFQGSVCSNIRRADNTDIIIGIVAGVSAGLLLCVIVGLLFFFRMKKTRKHIDLQTKTYDIGAMQMGNVKTIPMYDNRGFEAENVVSLHTVNRDTYLTELDKLRPHVATLLTLLNQIRRRLRAMNNRDPRVPTYKGVIHQLCRVLVLLHKKEPGNSIPSDALGLMEWAQQMLEDYRQETQEQSTSGSGETGPAAKISNVDEFVAEFPNNSNQANHYTSPSTILAVQGETIFHTNHIPPSHARTSGFYSSVPVPLDIGHSPLNVNHPPVTLVPAENNEKRVSKLRLFKQRNNSNKNMTDPIESVTGNLPMGYFANGRFYDPQPAPEIYAPASSYSDRSNQLLSTFMGDHQYSRSVSASDNSVVVGDIEDDDSRSENDIFPFDPKEATEPVEV